MQQMSIVDRNRHSMVCALFGFGVEYNDKDE